MEKYIKFDTKIHLFNVTILSSPLSRYNRWQSENEHVTQISLASNLIPSHGLSFLSADRRAMDFEKHRK